MKKKIIVLMFFVFAMTTFGYADISRTFNYQGRLTDLTGNPVSDGNYTVTFRLYLNATDLITNTLWSGVYPVATKNGYFNTILGSGTYTIPTSLDFSQQYYLGIQVGSDSEMTPRQPLNSVPYALNSANLSLANMVVLTSSSGTYTPSPGVKAILVGVWGAAVEQVVLCKLQQLLQPLVERVVADIVENL